MPPAFGFCPIQKIAFSRRSFGRVRALGVLAQHLCRAVPPVLGDREDRLLLQVRVLALPQDRLQGVQRLVRLHLRQPEHRLLPHLRIRVRVAVRQIEQDVHRLVGHLLRDQEHRLAAQLRRALVALLQHLLQDRHRLIGVHVQERAQRRGAQLLLLPARLLGLLGDRPRRTGVAQAGQLAFHPDAELVRVVAGAGLRVALLLRGQQVQGGTQVARPPLPVEGERLPVVRIRYVARLRIVLAQRRERRGRRLVAPAVEGLARRRIRLRRRVLLQPALGSTRAQGGLVDTESHRAQAGERGLRLQHPEAGGLHRGPEPRHGSSQALHRRGRFHGGGASLSERGLAFRAVHLGAGGRRLQRRKHQGRTHRLHHRSHDRALLVRFPPGRARRVRPPGSGAERLSLPGPAGPDSSRNGLVPGPRPPPP